MTDALHRSAGASGGKDAVEDELLVADADRCELETRPLGLGAGRQLRARDEDE